MLMRNQEKIYIIGHKNPDTDSICSAIAYADIKNRTTQSRNYVAKRAGQINEETEYVLNRFGVQPPGYMSNIGTQVKDMDIRTSPAADKSMSLKNAWDLMQENEIVTLPIRDKEGKLEGLITVGDITKTYMDTTDSYLLSNAKTQYRRIAETINGKVIEGNEHGYFVKGRVLVGTANPEMMKAYLQEDDMIIMGDREEDHLQAICQNVSCIIVGLQIQVSEKVIKLAHEKNIVIIQSPYDTFTIARLINQSIPIRYVMKQSNLVTFSTEDYTDDIQDVMIKHRHRAFPVVDKRGRCLGTISRRNFLDMHKKKVILVDHNERDQAVDNIEKADILEIIDHHKLGSLETIHPISFRNMPVGCTGTIMYMIYGEQKLEISPKIAGLLCAAIISDTLMFRSPTCTLHDKMAAGALALIAGIDIEDFARDMFKAGSNLMDKSPEEIFYQDYKKFIAEGEIAFGVGQISSMDSEELLQIKEKLQPFLVSECGRHDISRVYFMLTNIIEESSELLYYGEGSQEMAEIAFHMKPQGGTFHLKGVVSRKKQLIPAMMEAAQIIQNDFS
jgi:manganese-dependent inorganic pyrophosphatase